MENLEGAAPLARIWDTTARVFLQILMSAALQPAAILL